METTTTKSRPFFTIVTAAFESAGVIGELANSLERQTCRDFEWVVQDGGSEDGTTSIARRSAIERLHLDSRTDTGIYQALNRAVDRSSGDYMIFMGADDKLASNNVLHELKARLSNDSTLLALLGGIKWQQSGVVFKSTLNWKTEIINTVHHQGTVYSRRLFDDFRFDESVPLVADYELTLLLMKNRPQCAGTSIVVAECAQDGLSQTSAERRNYRDMHVVRKRHMTMARSYLFYVAGLVNLIRRRQSWV